MIDMQHALQCLRNQFSTRALLALGNRVKPILSAPILAAEKQNQLQK